MMLIKEQNVSEWALLKSSSSETSTSRMFMVAFNERVLPMVGKFITSSPGLLKLNIYSNVKI